MSLTPIRNFSDSIAGLSHPIGSLTPMQDLSNNTTGLLHPSPKDAQYTLIISHFIILTMSLYWT